MDDDRPTRRRSKGWMRAKSDRELHAIAGRFFNLYWKGEITPAQDATWEGLISELEYRARNVKPGENRCTCFLCWNPFDPVRGERAFSDYDRGPRHGFVERVWHYGADRRTGRDRRRRGVFDSPQERGQGDDERRNRRQGDTEGLHSPSDRPGTGRSEAPMLPPAEEL